MSDPQITDLLQRLETWWRAIPSALVAYSGGVDSALVMALSHQWLASRSLACIGTSPSYPQKELQEALEVAQQRGAQVRVVATEELSDPAYAANPVNRCYFCKSELYGKLKALAAAEGYAVILDGNNASDSPDDRPGWRAGREKGVRSPLAEVGVTKAQIRLLARHLELPIWDKPAMPCLSSRVPHGVAIVPTLLRQIELAERALMDLGFRELRVRHHGDVARLELPVGEWARALELRVEILQALRGVGYKFVTLDLAGLVSGGLHALARQSP